MRRKLFISKTNYGHRGSALLVVLLVMVVVSLLGMTLLTVTSINFKMTGKERDNQAVYYIAEAGINYEMNEITSNVEGVYNNSTDANDFFSNLETGYLYSTSVNEFEKVLGVTPYAYIKFTGTRLKDITSYTIESTGNIGNSKRTVWKSFEIKWIPKSGFNIPNDMAIFSNTTIKMTSGIINGPVGTNSIIPKSISLTQGAVINGQIYVGHGGGKEVLSVDEGIKVSEPQELTKTRIFKMPDFPAAFPNYPIYPNKTVSSDQYNSHKLVDGDKLNINSWILKNQYKVNTLILGGNYKFTEIYADQDLELNLDIGDQNRSIVVGNLNLNNGHLNIIGTGTLTIYVENNITFGSSSSINAKNNSGNQSDINHLNIYYKGTNPITLSGGQKVNGSLFSKSANIGFGAGSGFNGTIVTGGTDVSISGGANAVTRVLYAPNARVYFDQGGSLTGSVIANSIEMVGGPVVTYASTDNMDLPFFPPNTINVVVSDLIKSTDPVREKN
ncbi:PilX N-terminal domain-containing pilus assembly protein [Clostridium estertheticum]|uniref:DUF7305 domain-containing protein n=1 Tax=Clostridium estertheticum TaxID=238834 RepID=UPI001CF4B553|nr:PilX N-terminal domain-containing pilus assembly protein [Clostridium estertheticum]MCB2355924.1 hypothetical protein [Clostridium estertheticum]WAG42306.1 hypothetical protein LL065_06390 [Clostridium estertheticum]